MKVCSMPLMRVPISGVVIRVVVLSSMWYHFCFHFVIVVLWLLVCVWSVRFVDIMLLKL